MATNKNQPQNKNNLYQDSFKLIIHRAPHVTYFAESVLFPDVNVGAAEQPTTFATIQRPGDHMTFGEVNITFHLDEDLENWREIFEWMKLIGMPSAPLPEPADGGGCASRQPEP